MMITNITFRVLVTSIQYFIRPEIMSKGSNKKEETGLSRERGRERERESIFIEINRKHDDTCTKKITMKDYVD